MLTGLCYGKNRTSLRSILYPLHFYYLPSLSIYCQGLNSVRFQSGYWMLRSRRSTPFYYIYFIIFSLVNFLKFSCCFFFFFLTPYQKKLLTQTNFRRMGRTLYTNQKKYDFVESRTKVHLVRGEGFEYLILEIDGNWDFWSRVCLRRVFYQQRSFFLSLRKLSKGKKYSKMWCLVVQPSSVVLEIHVPAKAKGQELLEKVSLYCW